MRALFSLLVISCGRLVLAADNPTRHDMVVGTNHIRVIWDAPTNQLNTLIWVYKIIPQHFSPAVTSNLMTMFGFTKADQVREPSPDKEAIFFTDKERHKYLAISPLVGWVHYIDENAEPKKTETSTVPNDVDAYALALTYLKKFGIDRSQLETKNNLEVRALKDVGHRNYFDAEKKTNVQQVIRRGVILRRRADGIDFGGLAARGGVYFSFGQDGRIGRLEIVWKGLEPYRLYTMLTKDQLVKAIISGKTPWDRPMPAWEQIKTITVTQATPYYEGVLGDDTDAKFIAPSAELAVLVAANDPATNIVATMKAPILGEVVK